MEYVMLCFGIYNKQIFIKAAIHHRCYYKRCSENMSKFTGEHPCKSVVRTLAWVFSCKFAVYFQNTFFLEHLWSVTSE